MDINKTEIAEQLENDNAAARIPMQNFVRRGYAGIGLVQPKTPSNIGSALRAAGCYGASFVAVSGRRYKKTSQLITDVQNRWKHIPFFQQIEDLKKVIPYGCVPIAVDLTKDAKPISDFKHPERAFYIFGPEDGTLGKTITSWCKETIYIPTNGCMNLAASVNVVLYDRMRQYS